MQKDHLKKIESTQDGIESTLARFEDDTQEWHGIESTQNQTKSTPS